MFHCELNFRIFAGTAMEVLWAAVWMQCWNNSFPPPTTALLRKWHSRYCLIFEHLFHQLRFYKNFFRWSLLTTPSIKVHFNDRWEKAQVCQKFERELYFLEKCDSVNIREIQKIYTNLTPVTDIWALAVWAPDIWAPAFWAPDIWAPDVWAPGNGHLSAKK